ncbi:MAG: sigma factor [Solirubrobacterales bacterium]
MQEAMLRIWRGLDGFEGRSALRSWLYRIATNTCLDLIARRKRRLLPAEYGPKADPQEPPGEPVAEGAWIEPYPDEMLEVEDGYASPDASYEEGGGGARLRRRDAAPPCQRAVLILRDPTVANGQLAVGTYTWMEEEKTHVPFSLDVLTVAGDRIREVTAFVVRPADTKDGYSRWPDRAADPSRVDAVFRRFGLPDHVD